MFVDDFYEINYLWTSNINDMELVQVVENIERYYPIGKTLVLIMSYFVLLLTKLSISK